MKSKLKLLLFSLVLIVLVSGCTKQPEPQQGGDAERAKLACIQECKKALEEERDLSNGPCLSDEIIDDWVCDVAHSPRQPIDNDPANQCGAFRKGEAHHFVEVDPNCNFIKSY